MVAVALRPAAQPPQPEVRVAADVAEAFRQGIQLCCKEKWHEGYNLLIRVSQLVERRGNLPGVFYSYLGVAMARCDGRRRDGMDLCRYAVKVQPDHPENYLNLASSYLMLGRRGEAVRALEHGLQVAPGNRRLLALQSTVGVRQQPLFPFLDRRNPLNAIPGRGRAWLQRRKAAASERRSEQAELD